MVRPQQKVIVLDGDGALLMNLNSLPTAAARAPQNLFTLSGIIASLSSRVATDAYRLCTDLAKLAQGAGFEKVETVETQEVFEALFPALCRSLAHGLSSPLLTQSGR